MRFILRLWAILTTIPQRLVAQRGLVLASAAGLIASITLVMSVPIYADAVYMRILGEKIYQPEGSSSSPRPPFSFLFMMNGGTKGPKQWEEVQPFDEYFKGSLRRDLALPVKSTVIFTRTEPFALFPSGVTNYQDTSSSIGWTGVGYMTDLEEHVNILEGSFPKYEGSDPTSAIEVLVSEQFAFETGLQLNETFTAFTRNKNEAGELINVQLPVRVVGIWTPKDAQEDYWMFDPANLENVLFITEDTYVQYISPVLPDEVYTAFWYMLTDGSGIHSNEVGSVLRHIYTVRRKMVSLAKDVELRDSPINVLLDYQRSAYLLTIMLYAFSIPVLGLILAFLGLVAKLSVERQRNEIAVLRSRGATSLQVMVIIILENLLLGLAALAISAGLAVLVARLIGQTRSFLDFSLQTDLPVSLSLTSVQVGIAAVIITLVALVLPAISAARQTIVEYKLELSRPLKAPFWQRAFLDVLLFIPAAYGTYLLRQQGTIAILGGENATNPFRNPLLFLVPALGIFAASLFFLRLVQPLMRVIAWAASLTKNTGLLMAARQLARTPGTYHTPLVILILTLSLSTYTASLAQTLDRHLVESTYYRVGSDLSFLDSGDISANAGSMFGGMPGSAQTQQKPEEALMNRRFFIPVNEYLKVEGIRDVIRIGSYAAVFEGQDARYLGVDRGEFPRVAYWRSDFATSSLGALMNALAVRMDGVLVPTDFMRSNQLQGGDLVNVRVNVYGKIIDIDLTVVGNFDLFPTWYPSDGPLFVGNLDYLFDQSGGDLSYFVWAKTDPGIDYKELIEKKITQLNIGIFNWRAAEPWIESEQAKPERQGLFGLLFIGFAAAAFLTMLAFLLYVLFSFQRRFIELGVLRASGLSTGQMTSYLSWELVFLVLMGGGAGTALGIWASRLFIPFMQVGADASARIPPFDVTINWSAVFQIYSVFGGLFLLTLIAVLQLLRRMKVFEAIKLGETV